MSEFIIVVNEEDQQIEIGEKMEVHRKKLLHRAFSLFMYDKEKGEVLIHQRANGKYHSGGLWTNSCCSHPRANEELNEAVVRRTWQELGVTIKESEQNHLREIGMFRYFKDFGELAEHEIDHVFVWECDKELIQCHVDEEEIQTIRWISIEDLKIWLQKCPQDFTAWFPKAFEFFENDIKSIE